MKFKLFDEIIDTVQKDKDQTHRVIKGLLIWVWLLTVMVTFLLSFIVTYFMVR